MQIRAGGTNDGVCAAKTAEAEVMVDGGINDILITSQVSTRDKLARIAAMNKRADVKLTVDNEANIRLLSEVAQEQGVTVGVVIEVDTSMHRGGIRAVDHGVKIAKLASSLPGIKFRGVMSHQTLPGNPDRETRFTEGRRYIQMCLDVKDAIEAAGIPVEIVSSGESWTYDVAADIPGVTEVEGGTYFLMGSNYDYMADDFQYASKIMGTVISTPRSGVAIGDVGVRALASPGGVLPRIEGVPGVKVESLLDDHIVLRSEGDMPLKVGDKFFLTSGQQDVMVNRWDEFIAVRNGKVESVIEIPARGCFQ
jgi:D-serine deaminase-like pyridoxal phosphate-dependent protein